MERMEARKMKRKKDLVGWVESDWMRNFNFLEHSIYSLTLGDIIVDIPQIFKSKKGIPYKNTKVRITIEEL